MPIIVGITGHRDIRKEDIPELESRVKDIFTELKRKYPSTPLVLLTPLAEGADRLAFRVARTLGIQLIVPLPIPREDYKMDFTTDESRAEFDELLEYADKFFELPFVDGNTKDSIKTKSEDRDKQYSQVGAYIAYNCQILIALWDGKYTEPVKGTSEAVKFKLEGIPKDYTLKRDYLDVIDRGPVYHIVTPRLSCAETIGNPFSFHKLFPETDEHQGYSEYTYEKILKRIDTFNQDSLNTVAKDMKQIISNMENVTDQHEEKLLLPEHKKILMHYAIADMIAIKYKYKRYISIIGIVLFVITAFFFLHVYIEMYQKVLMLALYPITLCLSYALYLYAKHHDFQDKHLEYRAFAEGLRVQFFFMLAGIETDISIYYLRKHFSELEWIRRALRNLYIVNTVSAESINSELELERYLMLSQSWVGEQSKYYMTVEKRDNRRLEKLDFISNLFFGIGFITALTAVVFHPNIEEIKILHHGIVFTIVVALSFAAAIKGYIEKMVIAEQARQYCRSKELFIRAKKQLDMFLKNKDLQNAKHLILELGREALAENGDWLIIHRSKPLEVPRA